MAAEKKEGAWPSASLRQYIMDQLRRLDALLVPNLDEEPAPSPPPPLPRAASQPNMQERSQPRPPPLHTQSRFNPPIPSFLGLDSLFEQIGSAFLSGLRQPPRPRVASRAVRESRAVRPLNEAARQSIFERNSAEQRQFEEDLDRQLRELQQARRALNDMDERHLRDFQQMERAIDDTSERHLRGFQRVQQVLNDNEEAALRRVLESSFLHDLGGQPRASEAKVAEVTLEEEVVPPNETFECNICYDTLPANSAYVKIPCCSTTESVKRMHYKCALNCLRRSDRCPFCKSAKIAFK